MNHIQNQYRLFFRCIFNTFSFSGVVDASKRRTHRLFWGESCLDISPGHVYPIPIADQ